MRLLAYTIKQWVLSRLQRESEQEMADNTDQSKISTTVAVYHFVITLKYTELSELSKLSELCIMYHQQTTILHPALWPLTLLLVIF